MRKTSKTAVLRVQGYERRNRIMQMRLAGLSQEEIAYREGISRQAVNRHILKACETAHDEISEKAGQLRALESVRLERLIASLWPMAMGAPIMKNGERVGNERPCVRAHNQIGRYIALRCKLLGLNLERPIVAGDFDKPQALNVSGLSTAELEQLDGLLNKAAQDQAGNAVH